MKVLCAKRQACPIAYVTGHHPPMGWAASTRVPKEHSEIDLSGGLLGESVLMVPSETWGDECMVPADAEITIEGEILVDRTMENEGPFGEWTGYVGPRIDAYVVHVHAITRRSDAILVTEPMGQCGLYGISGFSNESLHFQMAQQVNPHVKAIHFPRSGNGLASCCISFAKQGPLCEGDQKDVAAHLCFGYLKLIIITDEDVDVFDEEEVMRAIILRCQASLDIDIVRGIRGSP